MTNKIYISVSEQMLKLLDDSKTIKQYKISTASLGVGQKKDSNKTPLGSHIIRAKIGDKLPKFAVFKSRRFNHKIWSHELESSSDNVDWILTRILWLSGTELGKNRLGDVDSMQRFIYIHGTNEENLLGTPSSHGCVRIANEDIIELFNNVSVGDKVEIAE
jgi:lipoprotein-anchoring transpeptidase ErfK/SrfK